MILKKNTGVRVYFEYHPEDYESYFDFNTTNVFDVLLDLYRLKTSVDGVSS